MTLAVAVLLITGAALNLIAAIGLHRFPDLFTRMHAATKPATLGMVAVLAGAILATGELAATTKLTLAAVLQFATNPVGGHMVGRAAWRSGCNVYPGTTIEPEAVTELEA